MSLRIQDVMTPLVHTIGAEQSLAAAHYRMNEYQIRHLPVLHGGRVVGLVSMGDLHLIETLKGVTPDKVRVEEAMTSDIYAVEGDALVSEVAAHLAERKLGSAIVVDGNGGLVGLFTTSDALRTLADVLSKREIVRRLPMRSA